MLLSLLCVPGCDAEVGYPSAKARALSWRIGYVTCFMGFVLAMWLFRDSQRPSNTDVPAFDQAKDDDEQRALLVLRVALAATLFFSLHVFGLLSCALLSKSRGNDMKVPLADWAQASFWVFKFLLAFFVTFGMMYISDASTRTFFPIARAGGLLFVLVQVLVVVEFVYATSEWLLQKAEHAAWARYLLLFGSVFLCLCAIVAVALLFHYFAPLGNASACSEETALLVLALSFGPLLVLLHALTPGSPGNLLTSGMVWVYMVFLACSALLAMTSRCDAGISTGGGQALYTQIVSFIISIGSIVYSVYSSSIDTDSVGLDVVECQTGAPELYEWPYFHLVFCLGAMHISQLFIGWSLNIDDIGNWEFDRGNWSASVKASTALLTFLLYAWSLIAPNLLPHRAFQRNDTAPSIA